MEFKGDKRMLYISTATQAENDNIKIKTDNQIISVINEFGEAVGFFGRVELEQNRANAKLFFHSQKMLEKLNECVSFLDSVQAPRTSANLLQKEIKELIEKATTI